MVEFIHFLDLITLMIFYLAYNLMPKDKVYPDVLSHLTGILCGAG